MTFVVAILTLTALGIPVALAVDRSVRPAALTGLAFLYGSGAVYVSALLLSLAGIGWSALNITGVALTIAGVCFFVWRGLQSAPGAGADARTEVRATPGMTSWVIDALTFFTFIGYAVFATIARPWEWDFWAIWGLKGRVFFESRGIDWVFLKSGWNSFVHPDYPTLVPVNYAWAALLGGGWDDRWLGLLFIAFAAALLLIVRELASEEVTPVAAAAITFASTAFVFSYAIGLAELPLIAFAAAGILLVRKGLRTAATRPMLSGALLLGLAASCKNEGVALVIAAEIAILFTDRRRFAALWPALALPAVWIVAANVHGLQGEIVTRVFMSRFLERLQHPGAVLTLLAQHLADGWSWALLLAGLLIVPAPLRRRERFVLLVVAFQLAAYVLVYFGTPRDIWWHIVTSWPRLTRQIVTPLLFVVMVMLAQTAAREDDPRHAEA